MRANERTACSIKYGDKITKSHQFYNNFGM